LFFAIVLPWFVAIQHKVPQFFRVFFIEHNLERFGTNLYQHAQPFWYYIPVFLLATLPWTVFALPALVEAGRAAVHRFRATPEPLVDASVANDDGLSGFLLVWIIVPIVFFSISRAKLPGYILPAIPAAALLTADYLHRAQAISRLKIALHALLCAVLLVAALMAPFAMVKQAPPPALQIGMTVTGAIIAIMVLLMLRREGMRALHFVTLVPTILAVAFLLRPAAATIDRTQSARAVQARLAELGAGEGTVAVLHVRRDVVYGLNFYRNQPILYYSEREAPIDMRHDGPPPGQHIVIAPEGTYKEVQDQVGQRGVASIGNFPPRHLEFFLVSAAK
jgi:4-amino-4-deoxy-L-arabinose transferase-like glycosyltransferase